MAFRNFVIILILIFRPDLGLAQAFKCAGKEADLKHARHNRDFLQKISNSKSNFLGEDILNASDYNGVVQKDSSLALVGKYAAELRSLVADCKVPVQKLGLVVRGVDHLERRATRKVLEERIQVLSKSNYTQENAASEEDIAEVKTALLKVGTRPAAAESRVEALRKTIVQNKTEQFDFAQKLAPESKCTPKDFRSKLPPVRDQADVGLCFAYAAADMASFKTGKAISALGLATAYFKRLNRGTRLEKLRKLVGVEGNVYYAKFDLMRGGLATDAFNAAKTEGMCLDKDFGASTRSGSQILRLGSNNLASREYLNSEFNLLREIERISALSSSSEKSAALTKLSDKTSCTANGQTFKNQFGSARFSDLTDVVDASGETDVVYNLFDRLCAPAKLTVNEEMEMLWFPWGDPRIAKTINDELDEDKIIAIGYKGELLYSPRIKPTGNHESTVVGRRFNKGACEYLVRNSWGADCTQYKALSEHGYPCENGHLWVPADVLVKNTRAVGRFKP